jgi:hypothetical protein
MIVCFRLCVQSFLSKPHFLDGDAGLVNNITGVRGPDRDIDDTVIDVEPVRVPL